MLKLCKTGREWWSAPMMSSDVRVSRNKFKNTVLKYRFFVISFHSLFGWCCNRKTAVCWKLEKSFVIEELNYHLGSKDSNACAAKFLWNYWAICLTSLCSSSPFTKTRMLQVIGLQVQRCMIWAINLYSQTENDKYNSNRKARKIQAMIYSVELFKEILEYLGIPDYQISNRV